MPTSIMKRLASDSHFKNSTRWQPRQVLGQVYVAPGLVETIHVLRGRVEARKSVTSLRSFSTALTQ